MKTKADSLSTTVTGSLRMREYRAYLVGNDGHFFSCRAFTRDTDADAIEEAKQLVDGHDVELWSGPRRVAILQKKAQQPECLK